MQTDLTAVTTTANGNKTDIVAIKATNDSQDARMTTIESDANGTKTTVSALQTTQGQQAGSISTLEQRADGFDATVTKVNNLSVGGRNLFKDSRILSHTITPNGTTITVEPFDSTTNMWHIVAPAPAIEGFAAGFYIYGFGSEVGLKEGDSWSFSADVKGTGEINIMGIETGTHTPQPAGTLTSDWKRMSQTGVAGNAPSLVIYFHTTATQGIDAYIKLPKLEKGNMPTDWSPAPEDVDSATAKAQLTADQATVSINNYKTSNDGRVSQAEANITANANAITTKVSQSDYNAKTGDLTTKVTTAQSTADGANTTIGAYKATNDARVASAEANITANANAIATKVSQSDYNTKTGQIDAQISTINQTANTISQTVSNVKAQVDGLSVGGRNLFLNSRVLPNGYDTNGSVTVTVEPFDSTTNMWHIVSPQNNGTGIGIYLWGYADNKIATNSYWSYSADIKGTGKVVNFGIELGQKNPVSGSIGSDWSRISQTGYIDNNLKTIIMYFDTTNTPLDVYIRLPKLETGNLPTDWSPAPEDTATQISTVSQTVDSISSIVSDPTTGLTKRVQTAEGTLSQVTGADIPNLQKATYWQPYGSLDFNSYTNQGSFFFNTTSAKTNGPTSSTAWTYLMVEQGTADSGRVKQTAWYDGVTGVKITYVRTLNSGTWSPWYANDNDSVATIAQTNGAIQTEISNRQTGDTNTLTQAKDFTTSSITNYDKGVQSQFTQTSEAIVAQVSATGIRYVRVNGQGNSENNGTHFMRLSLFDTSDTDLLAGKTATASGPNSPYIAGNNGGNGATDGNQSTYVSIYPEPNANNFLLYDLGALTYTAQKFEIKVWSGTRTYKSVMVQVSPDGKAWRTVFQENVKALSNSINQADTIFNLGATSSATVLSLLKDNWSIGIADNTGALASGIAGDANAMAIVSPKVTINSPQTQITGKLSANQIDVAKLSAVSAKLGDVTSGSITNPVNIAKTGNSNAVIVGNTLIDSDGVTMNADILVGGAKVYTENVTINPDTGLGFKWVDASGHIVRNATINELGVIVGTGSGLAKTTITETGARLQASSGDITNVDVNGVTASTWRTYTQTFSQTNMDMPIQFTRQGHVVTASVNFITYGPTPPSDQAAMSGGKLAVGWRPQSRVELMLNANTSGNNPMLVTISIFPDGTVQKTAPNIDHQTRMLGSTTYQTFMTLPDSSHANMVSDAQGYLVP